LLLLVGTILHPSSADPNAPIAAFSEYAASRSWVAIHLVQLAGILLIVVALISLSRLISRSTNSICAQIGAFLADASLAIAGALQAVDGVTLKVMVDRWAGALGIQKEMWFDAAFAVRRIEVGLASMLSLFLGITAVVYGVALVRDDRFSNWLGWLAVVGGLPTAAAGGVIAHAGFSDIAMTINMTANWQDPPPRQDSMPSQTGSPAIPSATIGSSHSPMSLTLDACGSDPGWCLSAGAARR
jgi:hypothetical protein